MDRAEEELRQKRSVHAEITEQEQRGDDGMAVMPVMTVMPVMAVMG